MPAYSFLLPLRTVSRKALPSRYYQTTILLQQTRWITQGRRPLKNLKKKNDIPAASSSSSSNDGEGMSTPPEPLSKILEEIHAQGSKHNSLPENTEPKVQEEAAAKPLNETSEEPQKINDQTAAPPSSQLETTQEASTAVIDNSSKTTQVTTASASSSAPKIDSETQTTTAAFQAPPVPEAKPHADNIFYRLFASWQQGLVASIGAMMGVGFLFFLFYNPVKEDTVHHTAVVASEALNDLRLRNQAVQLSKDVVDNVLKDPKSLNLVCELVVQLLAKEDTKIAVSSLLQSLFEDHYTQEVTKKFVLTIVRDPWIQDQLHIIFKDQISLLLQDEEVKQALTKLLITSASDGLEDPKLHYTASRAIRSWVATAFNATLASIAVVCGSYVAYEIRLGKS